MATITVHPEHFLERVLTLEIVRVTERAAVSAARLRGRGKDKHHGGNGLHVNSG